MPNSCMIQLVRGREAFRSISRIRRRQTSGNSQVARTLRQGLGLPFPHLLADAIEQGRTSAAGREVAFDLRIPRCQVAVGNPSGKLRLLLLGKGFDGALYVRKTHIQYSSAPCKACAPDPHCVRNWTPSRRNQLIITRRLSGRSARNFPETSAVGFRLSLRRCSSSRIVLGSCRVAVSYTHLDVYKRQVHARHSSSPTVKKEISPSNS